MRHVLGWIAAIAAVLVLGGAPAAAGPAAADFQVFVNAGSTRQAQTIANGGTANITSLAFYAGMTIDHNGGGEEATARVRFILPDGLHWGPDVPDATETCTGTPTTAECADAATPEQQPRRGGRSVWVWDIVADRPGSYTLRAETDLDVGNGSRPHDATRPSVTVVVSEASGWRWWRQRWRRIGSRSRRALRSSLRRSRKPALSSPRACESRRAELRCDRRASPAARRSTARR